MSSSPDELLTPGEASKLLNVTIRTLLNWDYRGKINCLRTEGGHRRFLKSDLLSIVHKKQPDVNGRKICYCRVSSSSQKEDLERKGFTTILDDSLKGNISEIVVTHKDRLCRFGFELVERIISQTSNGKIVVLNRQKTSPEEELTNDLISIITVFSSRLYGLRSHSVKKGIISAIENSKNKNISNDGRKEEITSHDGSI
jgi:excisionase family DNA binding protein